MLAFMGEPGIAGCNAVGVRSSCPLDVYLKMYGHACILIC